VVLGAACGATAILFTALFHRTEAAFDGHGAVVLAVVTADHRTFCPPDPARPLRGADRLVVLVQHPGVTADEGGEEE